MSINLLFKCSLIIYLLYLCIVHTQFVLILRTIYLEYNVYIV
jgi:hypothetical protein